EGGQYVSPDRRVLAAAGIEHHDGAGLEVVDVIAHVAGSGPVERLVADRVGASGHTERVIARLDSEALTGDPEPVERIADRRRVELRGAFGVLVGGHRCSQLEKLARVQAEYLLLVALGQPLDLAD